MLMTINNQVFGNLKYGRDPQVEIELIVKLPVYCIGNPNNNIDIYSRIKFCKPGDLIMFILNNRICIDFKI